MGHLNKISFAGLMMCFLSSAAVAQNDGFPDPGSVTIDSFSNNGSGCPAGTVAANLSPDNRAITLLFDSYIVDSTETESLISQKNCVINMSLRAPAGWRYALFSIDYRGYADLEGGVTAKQETTYEFGLSGQKRIGTMELQGPTAMDYHQRTVGAISELAWSDCGNNGGPDVLTINTLAQLDSHPAPTSQEVYLSSSRMRRSETVLADPVIGMDLIRKDSSSACKLDRSFGFNGTTVWVDKGCRALFRVTLAPQQATEKPNGFLTVDSIDAQLYGDAGQEYGIAWQRCGEGRWVQSDGNRACKDVCKKIGKELGRDPFGAECVSGEARPSSAAGSINFSKGCWGSCEAEGNVKTDAVGPFCYKPGQKRDADKTDRAVGCYCK